MAELDEFLSKQENAEYSFDIDQIKQSNREKKEIKIIQANDIRVDLDRMFEEGKPLGLSTGIVALDDILKWRRKGGLYCITGHEQQGKSEFSKFLLGLKAKIYKSKSVIYSPEEDTEDIIEDLCRTHLMQNVNKTFKNRASKDSWNRARDWVHENFIFIDYDGMMDFMTLINVYEQLAGQGYQNFLTDPWNYVAEGSMDQSGIKYLNTSLTHMKTFSKRFKATNIIIEHQNNRLDNKGNLVPASKDNITGGAVWKKKCDTIVVVHSHWTEDNPDTSVTIQSAKVKAQRYNGQKGSRTLYFDIATGSYSDTEPNKQFEIKYQPKTEEEQQPVNYEKPEEPDVPF